MKCKECGGSGWIQDILTDEVWECDKCNGKGVVEPLTEQEYIQTCNTEQLAEAISHLVFGGDFKKHISKMGYINMHSFKTEIVVWLKQPHTIKE